MPDYTPIYRLAYPVIGEPIRNTRIYLQAMAQTIEAALAAKGVPAVGASDLQAVSGRVSTLESRPVVRVRRNAAQSLPGGFTAIAWDTIDADTHGGSIAAGSIYVTVAVAGWYWIHLGVDIPNAAVAMRRGVRVFVRRNGVDVDPNIGRLTYEPAAGGGDYGVDTVGLTYLNANDQVRGEVFQDAGSAQNTGDPDFSTTVMELMWMRS